MTQCCDHHCHADRGREGIACQISQKCLRASREILHRWEILREDALQSQRFHRFQNALLLHSVRQRVSNNCWRHVGTMSTTKLALVDIRDDIVAAVALHGSGNHALLPSSNLLRTKEALALGAEDGLPCHLVDAQVLLGRKLRERPSHLLNALRDAISSECPDPAAFPPLRQHIVGRVKHLPVDGVSNFLERLDDVVDLWRISTDALGQALDALANDDMGLDAHHIISHSPKRLPSVPCAMLDALAVISSLVILRTHALAHEACNHNMDGWNSDLLPCENVQGFAVLPPQHCHVPKKILQVWKILLDPLLLARVGLAGKRMLYNDAPSQGVGQMAHHRHWSIGARAKRAHTEGLSCLGHGRNSILKLPAVM